MRGFTKPGLWSFLQLSCRSFSVAVVEKADKAMLSKLRKQTGIPFINCRKALIKFDNDFNQAKKWLLEEAQKEGWAKATKLQTRPMSHGLVAVVGDGKKATMIEVNCETDFVARNEKFIALVSKLVQECSIHFEKSQEKLISANKDVLSQVTSSDQSTFADIVALHIGSIGENMSLRRATYLRADNDSVLSTYVHPSSGPNRSAKSILLGKYGAIVELKQKHKVDKPIMALNELGSHICQHIVGMNPRAIGVYVPKETKVPDKEEEVTSAVPKDDAGYNSDDSSDVDKSPSPDIEEEKLLQQEYLLDTSMTVGEFLCINEVEVSHFVRYACGEELEGENEQ
uniref:Elongation factor Ts, mitochondrial n=1 Tax=Arion vulgaris TaxID=1028688 RepID=A0A0B7ADC3_9EUPU